MIYNQALFFDFAKPQAFMPGQGLSLAGSRGQKWRTNTMSQQPADPPGADSSGRRHHPLRASEALPRFRVILHAPDSGTDMMHVIRTIMELTRLCRAEATHKMWQAHHCGCSLLLITYKERAELYVEQFKARGLDVTVEAP
jgi:ATP-dependent Clp protease adapter protein ClpS